MKWKRPNGVILENTHRSYVNRVQFCLPCLKKIDMKESSKLTLLKTKVCAFDPLAHKCLLCGAKSCKDRYHSIKYLRICLKCIIKAKCICSLCQFSKVDTSKNQELQKYWTWFIPRFDDMKEKFADMKYSLSNYLERERFVREDEVYLQYQTVSAENMKNTAFLVGPFRASHWEAYERILGSGKTLPYVKHSVVNIFFHLLQEQLDEETKCLFIPEQSNLHDHMKRIFSKHTNGIFHYDFFIYTVLRDRYWVTIIAEQKTGYEYILHCFVPSHDYKKPNKFESENVRTCLGGQFKILKKCHGDMDKKLNLIVTVNYIYDNLDDKGRKEEDSGIYALIYAYKFFLNDDMTIPSKHIMALRQLVLFMFIVMDIRYGQIAMPGKPSTYQPILKH